MPTARHAPGLRRSDWGQIRPHVVQVLRDVFDDDPLCGDLSTSRAT